MICEKCGKEHDGTFGSGRFCSRSCANSRIRTEEIREKVSLAFQERRRLNLHNKARTIESIKHQQESYRKNHPNEFDYAGNRIYPDDEDEYDDYYED